MAVFGATGDSSLQIVIRARDEASKAIQSVETRLESFRRRNQAAISASRTFALGLVGATAAIGGFGIAALRAATNMEQTQIAFETMLGSAEKADEFIREMVHFAKTTPFELTGLENAAKRLLAYGFAQEEVLPNLKALGDIASGVGTEKLPNLILAFGQVKAATRLTGMELRQFSEAGVPLLGELAKQMDITEGEVQEMVSAGEVGFEQVRQAIVGMTEEGGRFNNLMDKQSKSLGGMISNLKDAWDIFLRGEGQKLLDWGKKFIQMAINIVENHLPKWINTIESVVKWFAKHKEAIIIVAGVIVGALVPAIMAAAAALFAMGIALAPYMIGGAIIGGLIAGILWIVQHWELVKEKTSEVWNAIKDFIVKHIDRILVYIGPAGWLILAIKKIIEHGDQLKAAVKATWNAIKEAIGSVVDFVQQKIDKLINAYKTMVSTVSKPFSFAGNAISSAVSAVGSTVSSLVGRAAGGPVDAGRPYMVGEQGPELFVPNTSGQIVPNNRMGTINVTIHNPTVRNDNDLVSMKRVIEDVFRDLAINNKLTHA